MYELNDASFSWCNKVKGNLIQLGDKICNHNPALFIWQK